MSDHVHKFSHTEDIDVGSGDVHRIYRHWVDCCGNVMSNQFISGWVDGNIAGVDETNYDKFR